MTVHAWQPPATGSTAPKGQPCGECFIPRDVHPGQPGILGMWSAYQAVLAAEQEHWAEGGRPCEVTAVAAAAGLDADELWDEVEGKRGWEPHDAGYHAMVWLVAWEMRGHPDWGHGG